MTDASLGTAFTIGDKPTRTPDVIRQEYAELCGQAGDLQYRIMCYQEELARINVRIRAVQQEFGKLPEAQSLNAQSQ